MKIELKWWILFLIQRARTNWAWIERSWAWIELTLDLSWGKERNRGPTCTESIVEAYSCWRNHPCDRNAVFNVIAWFNSRLKILFLFFISCNLKNNFDHDLTYLESLISTFPHKISWRTRLANDWRQITSKDWRFMDI